MRCLSLAVVTLSAVCGCGGSSGGKDGGTTGSPDLASSPDAGCALFAPCGGSVVGTWRIESGCTQVATPPGTTSACQPFTAVGMPAYTGAFEFTSEGSYSATMTITSSSKGTYSTACLGQLGWTCSDLNTGFSQPDASVSGTCTSNSSGDCDCSVAFHRTNTEQGTYTTSGNTFTTTPQGSAGPTTSDYCVQGNTLRVRFVDLSSGGSATFTVVATKQ